MEGRASVPGYFSVQNDYRGTTFSIGICSIDPDQKDVVEGRGSETETRGQHDDIKLSRHLRWAESPTDSSKSFQFSHNAGNRFGFALSNSPSSRSGEQKEYNSRYPPSGQNTSPKSHVVV
jgi:hypothetical protein